MRQNPATLCRFRVGPTIGTVDDFGDLQRKLGCELDADLLVKALTHRSYSYENGNMPTNERLEFVGDTVLGMLISEILYRRQRDMSHQQLARARAVVVNSRAIGGVARELGLGRFVRIGRGEEVTGGRDKAHLLAEALEAIIGAVYLDQGLDSASELVRRLFGPLIDSASAVV